MIMRKYVRMVLKHKCLITETKQVKTHPVGQTVIGRLKDKSIILAKESGYGIGHIDFRFKAFAIVEIKMRKLK